MRLSSISKINYKHVSHVDTTHKPKWISWASLAPIYATLQAWDNSVDRILEGEICVAATMRMSSELVEVIRLTSHMMPIIWPKLQFYSIYYIYMITHKHNCPIYTISNNLQ
jgi:hypothetical protein